MSRILDYVRQFQQLLPRGRLWESLLTDPVLSAYIEAEQAEIVRIEARATNLMNETNPLKTFELLPEWEQWAGLPEPCVGESNQTLQQRQKALHAKLTRLGGQSRSYYIQLAKDIGFEITITEFQIHNVDMSVDAPIFDEQWVYVWQVNAPTETVTYLDVTSDVTTAFAEWENELLECVISRYKPAHTTVIFTYEG